MTRIEAGPAPERPGPAPAPTPAAADATRGGVARDLIELTKPGIVRMVVITGAVGYTLSALAHPGWSVPAMLLTGLWCLIGVALSAAGANTLNQALETPRDAVMERTLGRPLPQRRLSDGAGWAFGGGLCVAGVATLWAGAGLMAALVSLLTMLTYLFWYTPLKPVTALATIIGAIPGALPPLIGWAAGAGLVGRSGLDEFGGWSLFAIMFVWQVPHFLAIAWKYREDYASAGFVVLPCLDPSGVRTARAVLAWSVALVPISLAPMLWLDGLLTPAYPIVASLLGGLFLWFAVRMASERTDESARRLFLASIAYLPLLLLAMVGDALLRHFA